MSALTSHFVCFFFPFLLGDGSLPRQPLLNLLNTQPSKSKQRGKSKRPPAHTNGINKEVNQEPINNDKRKEDTEAPPLIALVHVEHGHVLRARAVGTVLAIAGGVFVEQVAHAGKVVDVVPSVLDAGLARGRVEVRCFGGGALDLHGGEGGGDDTAHPPGGGVEVVHPVLPEDGVVAVRTHDTVEEVDHDEEEGEHVGDDGEGGRKGADPLTPAGLEEEEEHGHEEDVAGRAGVGGEAHGVVPEQPVDEARDDGRGDFADDIRRAEGHPAVDSTGVFTGFPEGTVDVELGNNTVQDNWRDQDNQEDGEHAVLHARHRVVQHPEGLIKLAIQAKPKPKGQETYKSVKDTNDDTDKQFTIVVRWITPVLQEQPLGKHQDLQGRRSSELELLACLWNRHLAAFLPKMLNLVQNPLVLFRVPPFFIPIDLVGLGCGFEDELRNVLGRGTHNTTVRKVLDNIRTVLANRTEVEGVSTGVESQDHVELLDQHGRRLVDGAHNRLTGLGELLQESHNRERGLTVQSTGRFIQEQQETGLRGQFDTDSHTLLLFHAERTDDSILDLVQLQQVKNPVNIGDLLLTRRVAVLSKDGRELESFTDGRCVVVQIHLFTETRSSLEVRTQRMSVDQHVTPDNTSLLALSQGVEQRGLPCSRSTHQSNHETGLRESVNTIQELPRSIAIWHRVLDIGPGEDAVAGRNAVKGFIIVRRRIAFATGQCSIVRPILNLLFVVGLAILLDVLGAFGRLEN